MHRSLAIGLVLVALAAIPPQTEAIPREILVEDDGGVAGGGGGIVGTVAKPEEDLERLCHVEYQVMKRSIGRCVKLGRSATGCVSGTYLHPFHPECL